MFELDTKHIVNTELPIIASNYKILHFDEYPILFTGTNRYGNKLIGSLAYEEDDLFRYFVTIVDESQYTKFYNRKISYRQLLMDNKSLFVIDKDINDNLLYSYYLSIEHIPVDYLPHIESFIPTQKESKTTLNFAFSLKGKLADLHKAEVNDVNNVNEKIYNYLHESLDSLNVLALNPVIYSQPSQAASYRLNFDIELEESKQMTMFPIDKKKVSNFITSYLNYVSYVLPDEQDGFLENNPDQSHGFLQLRNAFENIFSSSNIPPLSTSSDILIDNISSSAEKLAEVTEYLKCNNSFDSILMGQRTDDGDISTIGFLNSDYKNSIEAKIIQPENLEYNENVTSDEFVKDYRILVYKINVESGKGSARLYPDSSENYYKIKLYVHKGDNDITNSIFTKSLNENKVVDVKGFGTAINGIYKKLDCYMS